MNSDSKSETSHSVANKFEQLSLSSQRICVKSENKPNKLLSKIQFEQAKDDQEFLKESKEIITAHRELCLLTEKCISKLIKNDCILSNLPSSNLTFEEVDALISLEKGQGICVFIEREEFPVLKVVLSKPASQSRVSDLKKSFRCAFELERKRQYEYEYLKNSKKYQQNTTCNDNITISHYSKLKKNSTPTQKQTFTPPLKKISWRYIWRTYVFIFDSFPLLVDSQLLSDYGIANKSRLKFNKSVKYLKRAKQTNKNKKKTLHCK